MGKQAFRQVGRAAVGLALGVWVSWCGELRGSELRLAWELPTHYEDGTPLQDLTGCCVYYGTNSGQYVQRLDFAGGVSQATITGLRPDTTYYFAVTACDSEQRESGFSEEAVWSPMPWPPDGAVVTNTFRPTLSWQPVPGATWYRLWVGLNGKTFTDRWINSSDSLWDPDVDFAGGDYEWWVQPWGPELGLGDWAGGYRFSMPVRTPCEAVPAAPGDTLEDPMPVFEWAGGEDATWYHLWVNRDGRTHWSTWVEGASELAVTNGLPYGRYDWWVRPWNPHGYGPWSEAGRFAYGLPETVAPSGALVEATSPEFGWTEVPGAEWYYVSIEMNGQSYTSSWVQDATAWNPGWPFGYGDYRWRVRAWSAEGGIGPWSDEVAMTVGQPEPVAPIDGFVAWSARHCLSATWYQVWLTRDGQKVFGEWMPYESGGEDGDLRGVDLTLEAGNYELWVRAWSEEHGLGPWSEEFRFDLE